jgi:Zn-dependent peptidase ImmA (M78 family)
MIYCDIPVIYEQIPCGMERALGCFDPNINLISIKETLPDYMQEMVHAHECGHYYAQEVGDEELEALEELGSVHENREKLANSFFARQRFPQIVSEKEEKFWNSNSLYMKYLIKLIKQLMP